MRNYKNIKNIGSRFYFFIETALGFSYSGYTQDDSTSYPNHEDSKYYGISYLPQGVKPSQPDQHRAGSEFSINSSLASNFVLEVGLRYVIGGK